MPIHDMVEGVGQVSINLGRSVQFILHRKIKLNHVVQQIASIGFDSLPIAMIICFISGCVLALHGAERFAQTGAHAYVGGLVALAMIREMGPIFAALAVSARAGTAIAAEVSNMKVTSQVDALAVMHVDPIRYLLVPRVIACVVALPLITFLSEVVGIFGGMITAKATAMIHYNRYLDSVWLNVDDYDIQVSLIKATVFGFVLAGISVTSGLNARGGARSVGLATTHATVWTAICVLISDFFLTWIFFGTSMSM